MCREHWLNDIDMRKPKYMEKNQPWYLLNRLNNKNNLSMYINQQDAQNSCD